MIPQSTASNFGVLSGIATERIHLIHDGSTYFATARGPAELGAVIAGHPSWRGVRDLIPPLAAPVADDHPVVAYVSHGRWLADCGCGGAEMVWLESPRFWCCACRNACTDGAWRRVILPPVEARVAIEGILSQRPRPDTMNWRGESIIALQLEWGP